MSLDINKTYRAILLGAREGRFVQYGELATASDVEWKKARHPLPHQLGQLVSIANNRGWPLLSAIVVTKENIDSGTLDGASLKGFLAAAKVVGFEVDKPESFYRSQQAAVFEWAKIAPDQLNVTDEEIGKASAVPRSDARQFWWVNQNQTYEDEIRGGFLWSPKTDKVGRSKHSYDNMVQVRPGDVIFSFCDTKIKAVGIATGVAESGEKPNFGPAGDNWDKDGWFVPIEYTEVLPTMSVRPKDFIAELLPVLPKKYSPLQSNGNGNQGIYLTGISENFANKLFEKLALDPRFVQSMLDGYDDQAADNAQKSLEGRTDIGPTQKRQFVLARRGQGVFKANVRLNENACRITGVSDPRLLIASHIKPWAKSSDKEKLDGCNGLLLSPHVDRLFDRGLISFDDDGSVLSSSNLGRDVLLKWALGQLDNVGPFTPEQSVYMDYHRKYIFKQ